MNLLDRFILQHVQLTLLKAEVLQLVKDQGQREAKVELQLTPRLLQADSGEELPAYQVSARLSCCSGSRGKEEPLFTAEVRLEAVYRQVSGEALDIAEFTAHHGSLTRQIYPLLQQELRALMNRMGLEQVRLPFDVAAQPDSPDAETVKVSGAVH